MREIDHLHFVGFGFLADPLGVAARTRQDVIGVGLGLVARPLLVGARALDVVEGVDDRKRRLDALQLHLRDLDPGLVVVEQPLQQGLGLVGDLLALVRHRRLDRRAADDVAQRALGGDPDRQFRIVDPEQELTGIANFPEHGPVRLDDVLISGEHLPGAAALGVVESGRRAHAKLHLVDLGHLRQEHGFDRVGQMDVEAGLGGRDPLAEAQHDALFVRLNAIERGREPGEEDEFGQGDDAAAVEAGQMEEIADTGAKGARQIKRRRRQAVFARLLAHRSNLSIGAGIARASVLSNGQTLLEHHAGARAQFFALALELAAGGQNVAAPRRAHRARVAGVEDHFRKPLDRLASPSIRRRFRARG